MRVFETAATRRHLKAFMEDRGLKVAPWCHKARIRESTLRSFLSGRSQTMTLATLQALARAEGVQVADLIGETPRLSAEERQMLEAFRSMPEAKRRLLLDNQAQLLDHTVVYRVARWVLTANQQFGQDRSP